jgi:hypothetical protein
MAEITVMAILVSFGVVSLLSYIIFIELRKNQRLQKINEQGKEIIRFEKELDRTDSMKRGLYIIAEKRQIVKLD